MSGKMRKFRYRLLRALTHPQLYSLVFAVAAVVAWVHWRKAVGELKLNAWVALVFVALIFRPSIVELLRRTEKIETSWAQVSLKQLKEDIEEVESLEETNTPRAIHAVVKGDLHMSTNSDMTAEPPEGLPGIIQPATVREQAADLLEQIPSLGEILYGTTNNRPVALSSTEALTRLREGLRDTERLVLRHFGPEDGPNEFTPEMAEYLAAWTGVSGWTNVIDVWRRAKHRVSEAWTNRETRRVEITLIGGLASSAFDFLTTQLEAVTRLGRVD